MRHVSWTIQQSQSQSSNQNLLLSAAAQHRDSRLADAPVDECRQRHHPVETHFESPSMKNPPAFLRTAASGLIAAAFAAPLHAQVPEDTARAALAELRALVTEGTSVIGDLQPMINSGRVEAARVTPQALAEQLRQRYAKATKGSLDTPAAGLVGETRDAYMKAFDVVITRSQGVLAKGGQDAFVPAYFRARVLHEFNGSMRGKIQAWATNRDQDLINADWSVSRVMKGSANAGEVTRLMTGGGLDPVVRRQGDTLLGYWPMKLGAACVSCHAQNGLKQTEGSFGGALVAEIAVR